MCESARELGQAVSVCECVNKREKEKERVRVCERPVEMCMILLLVRRVDES